MIGTMFAIGAAIQVAGAVRGAQAARSAGKQAKVAHEFESQVARNRGIAAQQNAKIQLANLAYQDDELEQNYQLNEMNETEDLARIEYSRSVVKRAIEEENRFAFSGLAHRTVNRGVEMSGSAELDYLRNVGRGTENLFNQMLAFDLKTYDTKRTASLQRYSIEKQINLNQNYRPQLIQYQADLAESGHTADAQLKEMYGSAAEEASKHQATSLLLQGAGSTLMSGAKMYASMPGGKWQW